MTAMRAAIGGAYDDEMHPCAIGCRCICLILKSTSLNFDMSGSAIDMAYQHSAHSALERGMSKHAQMSITQSDVTKRKGKVKVCDSKHEWCQRV